MLYRPLHRTVRAAVVTCAAGALAALGLAAPAEAAAPPLPHLNITGDYVTGVSSGGFMATQLQVAYSGTFKGAGIIAAGPYDCGQGSIISFEACDLSIGVPVLEQQAVTWAQQGKIDPVSDLQNKPVYTYHGTLDPVVNPLLSDAGVDFYQHFGANTTYHDWDPAGHAWVTPAGPVPCGVTSAPFMSNCFDDPEGEMLTAWLGNVNAPNTGAPKGTLLHFNQDSYVPGGWGPALAMDDTAQAYVPPSCAAGGACKLVVALHGCLSGQYLLGDEFAEWGNLDTYADTNNLVVLYPQAIATALPVNPQGCWDWFGYNGSNFAVKSAPQMKAIMNMVHALGG